MDGEVRPCVPAAVIVATRMFSVDSGCSVGQVLTMLVIQCFFVMQWQVSPESPTHMTIQSA